MQPMMPEPADPQRCAGALPPALCAALAAQAEACIAALPPAHPDLQPTSGSLRLRALGDALFDELLRTLWAGAAGPLLRQRIGPQGLCLRDQCWLRRQHPPALRPPGQHPHQWHQDGALGCRFEGSDGSAGDDALAPLTTAWVALVDCGDDAPSLQWVDAAVSTRLAPPALVDAAVERRFGLGARRHARLAAGDALVFGGALLHRTHVTPAMRRSRISVEFRFAGTGGLPARLQGEGLRPVPD